MNDTAHRSLRQNPASRRRPAVRWTATAAVGLLMVAGARLFVWPPSSTPTRADAIVVLGGGGPERARTGMRLLTAGLAPTLMLSVDDGGRTGGDDAGCGLEHIVCFTPRPSTTAGEATAAVAAEARRRGWSSLAVVTSTYHLTRAGVLFGQCFDWQLATVEAPVARARIGFAVDVAHEAAALAAALTVARAC